MSYDEKLYIYSKLKSNKHNKAHKMQKFGISYGTIMNIIKISIEELLREMSKKY